MKALTYYILLILISISVTKAHARLGLKGSIINSNTFGDYFLNLKGKKGLILCFHGTGGSANGWINQVDKAAYLQELQKEGFATVCPTSKNRNDKVWNNAYFNNNKDVENVDRLLNELRIPKNTKVYLVGHSNGAAFVSRYSILSQRRDYIVAAHYANAPGISKIMKNPRYNVPSFFSYTGCDPIVPAQKVEANVEAMIDLLGLKRVGVKKNDKDMRRTKDRSCHHFVNNAKDFHSFVKSVEKLKAWHGFRSDIYLMCHPDVAKAVKARKMTAESHYSTHGIKERRSLSCRFSFNEIDYLKINRDVAKAVEKGSMPSGLFHYAVYGRGEGRRLTK